MEKLRKGLKKGDYFEDGGRVFVIDEVLEDGKYLSHKTEKPKTKKAKSEEGTGKEVKSEEGTEE